MAPLKLDTNDRDKIQFNKTWKTCNSILLPNLFISQVNHLHLTSESTRNSSGVRTACRTIRNGRLAVTSVCRSIRFVIVSVVSRRPCGTGTDWFAVAADHIKGDKHPI